MSLLSVLSQRLRGRPSGMPWLGVYAGTERLIAAYATPRPGGKTQVKLSPPFEGAGANQALFAWARSQSRSLGQALRANLLLNSNDYRILPVDAPAVPAEEQRTALRWQIKDLLDFPADEAVIDCLVVPGATQGSHSKRLFAVVSPQAPVAAWMQRFRGGGLALGAIDIPEMALRNLSVLCAGDSAHAFLHLGLNSTRLTLVWQRELCSFRQFEVSARNIESAQGDERAALLERLALEIQRTTDAFSRQFHGADLGTVWVSAVVEPERVVTDLAQWLPQRVQRFDLAEHVELDAADTALAADATLDFTLAIGAALRDEALAPAEAAPVAEPA